jgi:uncharacterized protein YcbX
MASVASLHVYPIKSCRGLDLSSVGFDALGPHYDRRLMVVDENGRFVTQREEPRMALITPRLAPAGLSLSAPEMPPLKIAFGGHSERRRAITIWRFEGEAEDMGETAADWLSSFLKRSCRLVRVAGDMIREASPKRVGRGVLTGFADGYPLLITTQASLDDLNSRLEQKLPMTRFRPNLVIEGVAAYAEDRWKTIRVGEVEIDVVKPCGRCAITTVDPINAQVGQEPLATLAKYRARDSEVLFGQNAVHRCLGTIRKGDPVEILAFSD